MVKSPAFFYKQRRFCFKQTRHNLSIEVLLNELQKLVKMVNLEVEVVSKELIKPSSTTTHRNKPCKLSLLSQLTPSTYTPLILFYPNINNNTAQTIAHLKKSLSEALTIYYPFSGRAIDNLFVDHFHEGVPFLEARAKYRLSDFLKHLEVESLNRFLPCQPFCMELNNEIPPMVFQATMFTCGGLVLGWCASHKFIDGVTGEGFMKTWAALSRGSIGEIVKPEITEASVFFPPRNPCPQNHLSLMESLWFTKANYITRRFVFSGNAIASLRAKAKGDGCDRTKPPSKVEALSCFIWKCGMAASKAVSGTPKPSILVETVNLRTRTKPPMSKASIGDVFWWATAVANPSDDTNTELHDLVTLLNEAVALYDSDYTQSIQGDEGYQTISDYCEQLEELFSNEKPDIFAFTSWCSFGFTRVNFGWGDPFWVGLLGKAGPAFRNLTVLLETKDGKGIEAWITLDQERMCLLENNPEFLTFASPNPKFSNL